MGYRAVDAFPRGPTGHARPGRRRHHVEVLPGEGLHVRPPERPSTGGAPVCGRCSRFRLRAGVAPAPRM
eukprot:8855853-Pyramimonas_sp.AAC.1